MKITGPRKWASFPEEAASRGKWRPWFAWRPVRVGYREYRWLEWVEKREDFVSGWDGYWEPQYRGIPK